MNNIFCVYEHWRPDKNEPFYVGKGTLARAREFYRDNRYHRNIIKKLRRNGMKPEMRIFLDGLEEYESLRLEIKRIAYWRAMGIRLANMTDGGEGITGYRAPPEVIAKKSKSMLGKKHTPEAIKKMSESAKIVNNIPERRESASKKMKELWSDPDWREKTTEAIKNAPRKTPTEEAKQNRLNGIRAYYASRPKKEKPPKKVRIKKEKPQKRPREEFIAQLRENGIKNKDIFAQYSYLGSMSMARPVICITDGRVFESASEASRFYSVCKSSVIELCLKNPRRKSVGGRVLCYEDEE